MISAFIHGFLLSIGIVCVIGPQNIFLLECGVRRRSVVTAVGVSAACDCALIVVGVFGMGVLVTHVPHLLQILSVIGVAFLALYGGKLLFQRTQAVENSGDTGLSAPSAHVCSPAKVALLALGFSLLNPGVYLDTLAILGTYSNRFDASGRQAFAVGACVASVLWFATLGWGGVFFSKFRNLSTLGGIGQRVMGLYIVLCAVSLLMTIL